MTHLSTSTPRRKPSRRFAVPLVALLAVAMFGAVMTLAGSTPDAQAQTANTTCYTINDGAGIMTSWTGGTQTLVGETNLESVEALAANQDRYELWTYDNSTQLVYTFTPGSATPIAQFSFTSGDLDSLTWVNHTNGDPSDDELWGTYRNPVPNVNNGPNEPDQIVQIDPATGAILSGPTAIVDPGAGTSNEQDDNDGLVWDPTSVNTFYGVIGGDSTANDLIIIDPATGAITQIDLLLNGGDILDIESLGAGTDGQLYGTTGEDGPNANQFIQIDKLTGVVTVIGTFNFIPNAIDPATNDNVDYEATACLSTLASLGDRVFEDTDLDGVQGAVADEPGIAGVTVNLLNGDGTPTGQSTVTDANGDYRFTDLLPGDYIVEVVPPAGTTFTIQDAGADDGLDSDVDPGTGQTGIITLEEGDNDPTNDAGIIPLLGSLGDRVFEDTDLDGVQGAVADEPGIAGVTVNLLNGDGTPTGQTTVTDANGDYLFDDLPAGDYIVEVVPPAGTTFTIQDAGVDDDLDSDVDPGTGQTGIITLGAGDNDPTNDAGIIPILASLGDTVFQDTDEDGVQGAVADEPGIAGVTVTLLNGDGTPTGQSTVTDANGNYSFDDLPAGDYIVEVIPPAGTTFTIQDAGVDDDLDSDVDPGTGQTGIITLGAGDNDPTNDAGIIPIPVPAIGLAKALSDGPTRIAGTTDYNVSYTFIIENLGNVDLTGVQLTDNVAVGLVGTGATVASGPTPNAAGDCSTEVAFGTQDLAVGEFCTAVWDFVISNPGGEAVAFDNSASVTGTPPTGPPVTDVSDDGADVDENDNGNAGDPDEDTPTPAVITALASIGNVVFEDTNEDGVQGDPADEPGVPGVTVTLLNGDGTPTGQTDTTDANGAYEFDDLDPGDYIVVFDQPAGRDFSPQDVGGDEAADSDADPVTGQTAPVTLAAGDNNEDVDAGLTALDEPVGSISNLVFDDLDGNGVQDPGEPGIPGVTVTLLDGNGDPIAGIDPLLTDGDGNYIFANLPAGDYIVQFSAPDGSTFSPANVGDDDADSDAGPDGRTTVITLPSGQNIDTVDAGVISPPADAPAIGLAKALTSGPTVDSDGVYTLTYTFIIENLGNVALTNVGIVDEFAAVFAGATIEQGATPAGGDCSAEAATGTASLAVGQSCTAVWEIKVSGVTPGQVYNNTATATGTPPEGPVVTDISNDGAETDPNNNGDAGDPDEDTPSPVEFPADPDPTGSIGDRVFLDANNNGVRDAGEAPVSGATVELFSVNSDGTKNEVLGTVVTGADGLYNFSNLAPGDYIVDVTPPTGFVFGPQNAGSDDTVDSDISPTTGESAVISVAAGQVVNNVDAGLVAAAGRPSVPVIPSSPALAYPTITNAPGSTADPVSPAPAPPLAVTGSNSNVMATLAIAMMVVGGTMLIGARRKHDNY